MEQVIIAIVAQIVGGIILLIFEYSYLISAMARRNAQHSSQGPLTTTPSQRISKTPREYLDVHRSIPEVVEDTGYPISAAYQRLALILVSIASAYGAGSLLRLWANDYYHTSESFLAILAELISTEDFVFVIALLVMIISGAAIAYLVDSNVDAGPSSLLPRYFLTILVSFLGAYLGCVAVPIIILIIIPKDGGYHGMGAN